MYIVLLSSLKAASHAADDTDRSISGTNNEFARRQKDKTGDALAESFFLRADNLECIRDHVDGKNVARCRPTVKVLIVRRHLETCTACYNCSRLIIIIIIIVGIIM